MDTDDSKRADLFATELTELCIKHGIGIAGSPVLFVMEPDDVRISYAVDDQSNLVMR